MSINLNTSESVIAKLSGAPATNQPTFVVNFIDTNDDLPSQQHGTLNGVSEVTILAAPQSGRRVLQHAIIHNTDTAPVTVTVQVASGASRYTIAHRLLAIGDPPLEFGSAGGGGGVKGDDGPAIELQVTATKIQWRVVGDATWTDLITLSALQGPSGQQGPICLPVTVAASRAILTTEVTGHMLVVGGAYTATLPAAVVGRFFEAVALTAAAFSLDVQAGEHWDLAGTALSNGHKITSDGTKGAWCKAMCLTTGVWTLISSNSSFVDGGE